MPNTTAYAASKGAVEAIGRVWASELSAKKVTVNTLAPVRKTPFYSPALAISHILDLLRHSSLNRDPCKIDCPTQPLAAYSPRSSNSVLEIPVTRTFWRERIRPS